MENKMFVSQKDAKEPVLVETVLHEVTEESDELPEGKILPLNSKKLNG